MSKVTATRTSESASKGHCDYYLADGSKITNIDKMPPKTLAVLLASQGHTQALELLIKSSTSKKAEAVKASLPQANLAKALPPVVDEKAEFVEKLEALPSMDNRELRAVELHKVINDLIDVSGERLAPTYKKLYEQVELHHNIEVKHVVKTHKKSFSTYNTGTDLKLEALASRLTPKVLIKEVKSFFNL